MKSGPETYLYRKQVNGRGAFGSVTIEIVQTKTHSTVTDACEWKTHKDGYPNFIGVKIWLDSAVLSANAAIKNLILPENIEIIIRDIIGLPIDTCPSHIGAVTILGIFDYCDMPLSKENIKLLDEFTGKNNHSSLPDYNELCLMLKPTLKTRL